MRNAVVSGASDILILFMISYPAALSLIFEGGGTVSVIHPLVVMNRRLEQALQSKSLSAAEEDKTLKFGSQVMLVNHKSEGDFWFPAG